MSRPRNGIHAGLKCSGKVYGHCGDRELEVKEKTMSNRRELIWGLLHSVRSLPKIFDWPVVRVSFQLRRSLRILGGTGYIGPHFIQAAVARATPKR